MSKKNVGHSISVEEFKLVDEPFYIPINNEIKIFEEAYNSKIPVILKGPTGSGKTRFIEYMAWKLKSESPSSPLITVACHEDLTASDLVGRYLIEDQTTKWIDGPITRAARIGAICYLDEVVEARKDTTVLIHPLTDYRRLLPIEKKGELWLTNCYIKKYSSSNDNELNTLREKKILVNKKELNKIIGSSRKDGMSIIPINLYFNSKGFNS